MYFSECQTNVLVPQFFDKLLRSRARPAPSLSCRTHRTWTRWRLRLTREVRVRHQLGDHVPAEYVQMLGKVAFVGHATVTDHVVASLGTTTLHQGREQAGVVEQTDLVAAEIVTRVLSYAPFGHFGEVVPVLVTLERGDVPVHAEIVQHVIIMWTSLGDWCVVFVFFHVIGVEQSSVSAITEQPACKPYMSKNNRKKSRSQSMFSSVFYTSDSQSVFGGTWEPPDPSS